MVTSSSWQQPSSPHAIATPSIFFWLHWSPVVRAPSSTRHCVVHSPVLSTSHASACARSSCLPGACRAWPVLSFPRTHSPAAPTSHPRDALSTTRSLSPVSSIVRRAFPRVCVRSLRGQTHLPEYSALRLLACHDARVEWSLFLALLCFLSRELLLARNQNAIAPLRTTSTQRSRFIHAIRQDPYRLRAGHPACQT